MKSLRAVCSIILLTGMVLSGFFIPSGVFAAAPSSVSKITVTFHGNTETEKGFAWYTDLSSNHSDLQIVKKTSPIPDFTKAATFSGRTALSTNSSGASGENVHKAEAVGLTPGTTYFFRVGDAGLGLWSEPGTFYTAPKSGPFTFIDLADTQAKEEDEAKLSAQTIAKAFDTFPAASFLIHNGDIVDTGSKEKQWDWLLGNSEKNLTHTTILPAAGNHEKEAQSFIEHFNIIPAPNSDTATGAYYSVNYRNAHFIILNNNEDSPQYADFTPQQIQWLKEDAKAAKAAGFTWIIAVMHKGPYTTSNHATDKDIMDTNGVRTLVAPIMEELDIDLVLQGHDHIYARTKPLKNGTVTSTNKMTEIVNGQKIEYATNPKGTIYLIPNTAGPKVYYKNKTIDPSYYNLFEAANEHAAAAYGPDPADPTRPVRSQVQNFAGITIDGNKLTAFTYEVDQSKNNGQPYVIDQFGILKKGK